MKLNQSKPELVLDLTNVKGASRKLLSLLAQTILISMGFHWEPGIFHPLDLKNHLALHINTGKGCPLGIRATHDCDAEKLGEMAHGLNSSAVVYDANTQIEAFLKDAMDLLPHTRAEHDALDKRMADGENCIDLHHNRVLNRHEEDLQASRV
jgi:hypothetical protein